MWMTIQQVAERWGVSYDTVRREVLSGKLPSMPVGSMRRISVEVIEQREREGQRQETNAGLRSVRRAAAFAASGKDHYPDC
jgi:excisionase family DNA binding protein